MIEVRSDDMFAIDAQVRVNTVNCVGVMGKGVALEFKKRWPKMYEDYKLACAHGEVTPCRIHIWNDPDGTSPLILNFPTKYHWRNQSEYSYILGGLIGLRNIFSKFSDKLVITIPPLGCGNGGLDWSVVLPMIQEGLKGLAHTIYVFEPRKS